MSAGQPFRLPEGGAIDRSRPVEFTFNGRLYRGFDGDTLASALLANGVAIVGRSLKYHRPRGVLSAGEEEPNALLAVTIGRREAPIARAPLVALESGLVARSQNCFPGVDVDFGRVLDFTRAMWPAGFYNKIFKWPGWHWYEGIIRRAAGLGSLPKSVNPCAYHHHNTHCDVLICGAGPAGLTAAVAAGRSGARVVLAEQDAVVGGRLLADPADIDGKPAAKWLNTILSELAAMDNVRVMTSATVAGYYDSNVLTVVDRADGWRRDAPAVRFWKVRAAQVVIATGAIEQPLVFDNNDRPGIILAGAAREYLSRYAVLPGSSIALVTNNDEAYRTAFMLYGCGCTVPAIVDTRPVPGAKARAGAELRGIPVMANAAITATRGTRRLRSVTAASVEPGRRGQAGTVRLIACDALAVSGGWNPTVHLYSQAGGKLRYDESLACFVPRGYRQAVKVVGAANGDFDLARSLADGFEAGRAAVALVGFEPAAGPAPKAEPSAFAYGVPGPRISPLGKRSRQWIDLLHDVTAADIELAVRENFVSVEHMKRYTTAGMSVDQGKTSNLNALTLLAELTDKPVADVGTTTFRPQYTPVPMGAIAGPANGALYEPSRQLPAHAWHQAQGAVFADYGEWKRPAWYRKDGDDREGTIRREVLGVRHGVGLFDGSPLGKIEVRGPDAAEFLNRIYVNDVLSLQTGRVRYGLMLDENGIIVDDGVCARLSEDQYLVSTTSGNADRVGAWLDEWHQCEWPDLKLVIAPVTDQWAVLTLSGPRARALLSKLDSDIDFSAAAFPHMHLRTGTIEDVEARVQRVSYTGEVTFEVNVSADCAEFLVRRLAELGDERALVPVGIEAILVLRMEKGYLHVGSDTDGTTNPFDVGFGRIVEKKTGDFVGRRSLSRPNDRNADRRRFVGLEAVDGTACFVAGAHVVRHADGARYSEGFVTSVAESPTLGKTIGLAMIQRGNARTGETVMLFDEGRLSRARIVDPVFYDPDGERLHG